MRVLSEYPLQCPYGHPSSIPWSTLEYPLEYPRSAPYWEYLQLGVVVLALLVQILYQVEVGAVAVRRRQLRADADGAETHRRHTESRERRQTHAQTNKHTHT